MRKITINIFSIIALILIFNIKAKSQKQMPSLNHITIFISDLKKSVPFYQNIIQLELIPNPFNDGRHIFFKIGKHSQLHVVQGVRKTDIHDKNDHMAFTVKSLEAFITHLNKEGVAYEDFPGKKGGINVRNDGVRQIYFQDPDGYWIEINNDKY